MKMDLNAIIEKMETGDQDAALLALQTYNKEVKDDYWLSYLFVKCHLI